MNSNLFRTPPAETLGKYTVNIEKEDLINLYVRKWVLKWCRKYHPEAFEEGERFIRELISEDAE